MIDSSSLFEASRVKLKRARQFVDELKANLEAYRAKDPLKATVAAWDEEKLEATMNYEWKGIGIVPGAIIGDAIHNMRTALDLMASEMARMNGLRDDNVYFPFSESKDMLKSKIKDKNFRRCGKDAVDLLVSIAPYSGGNDLLRALHDLDIQDKHTALIPAGTAGRIHVEHKLGEFGEDKFAKAITFNVNVDPSTIDYIFPPNTPFDGRSVLEVLEELMQAVEGVLQSFSSLVAARA